MKTMTLHARLANREPGALDEFYAEYRGRILAVARRYGRNEWDADEILQDVAWIVHRKADTFNGDAAFSSWVYRVSQNAARMHIRKNKNNPTPMDQDHVDAALERSADGPAHARPDELAPALQMQQRMADAFRGMDPINQAVFERVEIENGDRRSVARELNLSTAAFKARLHRARVSLRDAAMGRPGLEGSRGERHAPRP